MQPEDNRPEIRFSVVIPLYNKEREIERTLRSVAAQTYAPAEVIVVDDGSTDGSASVVERLALPGVQLVRQPNGGVSAARNRGIREAGAEYVALLDADDWWKPEYLGEVAALIRRYPGCGMYCMGFDVARPEGTFPNETEMREGIVDRYFRVAMRVCLTHTSSVTIPRGIFDRLGGFPDGMKLGEDQYMWTKIARSCPVCYSPQRCSVFNLMAQNRSAQNFRMERTACSFREFYDPATPDCNEYIARCEIGRATIFSASGYTAEAREIERGYAYTRRYRFGWWKLRILNRLPVSWRLPLLNLYKRAAWLVSRKGLFE